MPTPAKRFCMEGVLKSRIQGKRLIAKNPSEARGIRKALRAAGFKFEFKSGKKRRRKSTKKRNPAKRRTRRKSTSKTKRRRR